MIHTRRLPFMILAMLSLLTGIMAGLFRIGWPLPLASIPSPHHGAIMVGGFLGALISLEKIVTLKVRALYLIPLLAAGSTLLFLTGAAPYAFVALIVSSTGLCLVFLYYLSKTPTLPHFLMLGGAVCWMLGNVKLLLHPFYPSVVPWWMSFALLVIASERLELMKFLPVSRLSKSLFAVLLFLSAGLSALPFHGWGHLLQGSLLILISLWLMKNDLIGISINKKGLTRYVAITLLSGYMALLFSGVILLVMAGLPFGYDVFIHVFFIGFVFAMILAHGPIILPGVLGLSVKPYNSILYFWVALLMGSWMLRAAGGILLVADVRKYSGLLSAIAVLGYLLSLIYFTLQAQKQLNVKAS